MTTGSLEVAKPAPPLSPLHRFWRWQGEHVAARRGFTSVILLIVLWQIIVGTWLKHSLGIATPSAVYSEYILLAKNGELWKDFSASGQEFFFGVAFAIVIGIPIGLVMGGFRTVRDYFEPLVSGAYATPVIALGPLFILYLGIGINSKIAVVFILAILPIIINTQMGIRTVDQNLIETARAFSVTPLQMFKKVLLPAALPQVLTGLRLGLGRGLLGVVAGELFAAQAGLGFLIVQASQQFDPAGVFVGISALACIGISLTVVLKWIERRVAPWRENR